GGGRDGQRAGIAWRCGTSGSASRTARAPRPAAGGRRRARPGRRSSGGGSWLVTLDAMGTERAAVNVLVTGRALRVERESNRGALPLGELSGYRFVAGRAGRLRMPANEDVGPGLVGVPVRTDR